MTLDSFEAFRRRGLRQAAAWLTHDAMRRTDAALDAYDRSPAGRREVERAEREHLLSWKVPEL